MSRSESSTILSSMDSSYSIKWNRLYRGSENEFSAVAFHRLCDNQGSIVVLVRSGNGRLAAGYSCVPWKSTGSHESNPRGFLCAIDSNDLSLKLIKGGIDQCKVYYQSDCGPYFWNGLYIADKCDKNLSSNSTIGPRFENQVDQYALFGSPNFAVVEYEVFGIEILVAA
jgi:hypothetical protein